LTGNGCIGKSGIEYVLLENKTGKLTLENRAVGSDGAANDPLPAFFLKHFRLGCHCFPYPNGSQETGFSSAENHERVIDGKHGGIIGKAEGKTPVNKTLVIHAHFGSRLKTGHRLALRQLNRLPDQSRGDSQMSFGFQLQLSFPWLSQRFGG
jgi:hypothetical protein